MRARMRTTISVLKGSNGLAAPVLGSGIELNQGISRGAGATVHRRPHETIPPPMSYCVIVLPTKRRVLLHNATLLKATSDNLE